MTDLKRVGYNPFIHTKITDYKEWLHGFNYRIPINITGGVSGTQTNFQLKIDVPHVSNMLNNFNDLRFTHADGTTLIDAWLESKVDGTSAVVWVEFPTTPANGENKTYYMYYGNEGAANAWDIEKTMVFGDDFSGAVIDTTTRWNSYIKGVGSSITLSGGEGIFLSSDTNRENYAAVLSKDSFGENRVLETRAKFGAVADNPYKYPTIGFGAYEGSAAMYLKSQTALDDSILFFDNSSASSLWGYQYTVNGVVDHTAGESISTTYKKFTIERYATNKARWLINDVEVKGETATIPDSTQIALGVDASTVAGSPSVEVTMYCDWIFVRKYAANPPTYSFDTKQSY